MNPATSGKGNSAFGNFSLWANTTGGLNTSTGDNALFSNTIGSYNTANGYRALYNNSSGNQNTAYGNDALFSNQTGKENVAVGNEALMFNKTGSFNTALGDKTLKKNIQGSNNTAIGSSADVSTDNLTNATAIGSQALVSRSNSLILGSIANVNGASDDTNVGIGVTNPESILHINPRYGGGILIGKDSSSGDYTTLEMGISEQVGGYSYIQSTQETINGNFNKLALNPKGGYVGIGVNNTSPSSPLDIQQSYGTRGLTLRNKNYDWDLHVLDDHNFGFSYVGGAKSWIDAWDGTWNVASDGRLKKNVNQMGNVLAKVLALQPKTYQYINNESDNKIVAGFIAQEVMPLFPELVSDFKHATKDTKDDTIYHGLNYAGFSVIAIKAIQEQQQEIETLKKQLKLVLEEIERLKKK